MFMALIDKHPVSMVVAIFSILVLLAIGAAGGQPYGQESIDQQIAVQNGDLCGKFGFAPNTTRFTDCTRDLAYLRSQHESLLIAYSWP